MVDATKAQPGRPVMPDGYLLDRDVRLLPWSYVSERMAGARNYWIASTRGDGRPHVMPVWGVWLDEVFYFGTHPGSVKGRNFSRRPEIVVHLESGDETVILEGRVETVADRELMGRISRALSEKYSYNAEEDPDPHYYTLRPRKAMAWNEKDFPHSATRWLLEE